MAAGCHRSSAACWLTCHHRLTRELPGSLGHSLAMSARSSSARMLMVLSPAKTLDFSTATAAPQTSPSAAGLACEDLPATFPPLSEHMEPIVRFLQSLTPGKVKSTLGISDSLAKLNHGRYRALCCPGDAKQEETMYERAALAYNGDAYTSAALDARSFSKAEFGFAQAHLRIISGLYGVVRPLDYIQPYRLCMGTKMAFKEADGTAHSTLYSFWQDRVTSEILAGLAGGEKEEKGKKGSNGGLIVNLASNEYWKAVDGSRLAAAGVRVVSCAFRNDGRVMSVYAKKARGLMCRYIIQKEITDVEGLKKFNVEGYAYVAAQSSENELVFDRRKPPPKARGAACGKRARQADASKATKEEEEEAKPAAKRAKRRT